MTEGGPKGGAAVAQRHIPAPCPRLQQGAKAPCADAGVAPCGKGVLGIVVAWL